MENQKYLLGFDVGTQGSKLLVISEDGKIIAYDYCPHDVIQPHPGWVEQDALKTWWGDFVLLCRRALVGIDPGRIAAIGVSAMIPCVLPVDEKGEPLRNAILYGIDTRAEEDIRILNESIGTEKIKRISKSALSSQSIGPKIHWIKRNEPENFEKARYFLPASGYLTAKLTGQYMIDRGSARETVPLYDFTNHRWSEELCRAVGISPAQLPAICETTDVIGGVTQWAAAQTGLRPGTPVVGGTGDFAAEIMSMGGSCGDTFVVYGSTTQIFHLTNRPMFVEGLSTTLYPAARNHFLIGGGTATSGLITKWFRDQFCQEERRLEQAGGGDAYEALSAMAETIRPGADGLIVLPYFSGERSPIWDAQARGIVAGLTLRHTKAHLYRAILEGIGYSVRHHIELLDAAGLSTASLVATGGGTKSRLWTQIVSDITGLKHYCLPNSMGAPAGDAYLAGIGVGIFSDLSVLREKWIRDTWTVHPNTERKHLYDQCYQVYRAVYQQTCSQIHQLSSMSANIK